MDGLLIKHIPQVLLARILVQLYIIPQQAIKSPQFNLLSVLVAGLRDYGQGEDLDGFFSFCTRQSFDSLAGDTSLTPSSWLWKDYTLHQVGDWDLIGHDQLQDASEPSTPLIGLRVQLASEKVRTQIELIRYGKKLAALQDDRLTCTYEGQHISVEDVLDHALEYMSRQSDGEPSSSTTTPSSSVTTLLKERLAQLKRYRQTYDDSSRSETDFVLMGALMVKLDAPQTQGAMQYDWYLYLRDYMADDTGSTWRILKGAPGKDDVEIRISSYQVLADLRGTNVKSDCGLECLPSPMSVEYRPVYLFYCNNDIVSRSAEEIIAPKSSANGAGVTLADYSFDDDHAHQEYTEMDYDVDDDVEPCKYCGIPDSIDDINTIFFCDECNQGVHQLCEQPPISAFEMDVDPWYCRDCCRRMGLALPVPPPYMSTTGDAAGLPSSSNITPYTHPSAPATDTAPPTPATADTPQDEMDGSSMKKRKLDQ